MKISKEVRSSWIKIIDENAFCIRKVETPLRKGWNRAVLRAVWWLTIPFFAHNRLLLVAKARGEMLKRVQHDVKRVEQNEKMEIIPGTKMSKFANSMYFPCHVVGVFPSRGSTFSLARQCFWACRDTCIGCMICKNFYIIFAFCPCVFLHFGLLQNKGAKCGKCGLASQNKRIYE